MRTWSRASRETLEIMMLVSVEVVSFGPVCSIFPEVPQLVQDMAISSPLGRLQDYIKYMAPQIPRIANQQAHLLSAKLFKCDPSVGESVWSTVSMGFHPGRPARPTSVRVPIRCRDRMSAVKYSSR